MSKKIKLLVIMQLCCVIIYSQYSGNDCPRCNTTGFIATRNQIIESILNAKRLKAGTECDKKIVRLNIYFIQDDNGFKNFSAQGDGLGNSYTGKDFAYDMINYVNNSYGSRVKLRIPPNNNISADPIDIRFVIEGIYYVRSTVHNREITRTQVGSGWSTSQSSKADLEAFRQGPIDSVIHIFIQGVGQNARELLPIGSGNWVLSNTYGGGGLSMGSIIRMGTYARYWAFRNRATIPGWPQNDNMDWVFEGEGKTWEHELGHELNLSHTVVNLGHTSAAGADFCPTITDDNFVATDCDDGLPDTETPSAWYMRDVLNAPIHPATRNQTTRDANPTWWSNNMMDYGHEHALSPAQIRVMHEFLRVIQPAWIVENAQWTDRNYCSWIANRIAHYGRRVNLNRLCSPNLRVLGGTNRKVIASQTTEFFGGFEVLAGGEFEIINTCPKP